MVLVLSLSHILLDKYPRTAIVLNKYKQLVKDKDANFVQLDSDNVVAQVIVVSNDDTSDSNGTETESIGVAFCQKLLGADTNWKQTS